MSSPLTTAEISTLLKVQPRVLRALLRSTPPAQLPTHLTPVGSGGRYSFTSADVPILSALLSTPRASSTSPNSASSDIAYPHPIPNPLKNPKETRQAVLEGKARAERLMAMMANLPRREKVSA